MTYIFYFFIAAGLGAILRLYLAQSFLLPWGTFAANLLGSLLIGFLWVYLSKYSPQVKTLILVALLGSMTTFSTYALEVVRFLDNGAWGKAFFYFTVSNSVCFLACWLGWKIANKLVING